jgi:SHS2 domain-containing protein
MRDRHWQHFPHDAGLGVRGFGDTLNQAFEQAAMAVTGAVTDAERVSDRERIEIGCEASDHESLLLDWLNAVIDQMTVRKMLFRRFAVHIDDGRLRGEAWGEPFRADEHKPALRVRGASRTHLRVDRRPNDTWVAECVLSTAPASG